MELPHRKPIRIQNFDYSQENYYFVTICTHDRYCLFGMPETPTLYGQIAALELENVSTHYTGVVVEKYIVMPNHIHAIIIIGCDMVLDTERKLPDLSTIVGLYKSGVSKKIHEISPEMDVW